ncbi:Duplicated homeodomain-like superfamily protein, partial [Zea mays]
MDLLAFLFFPLKMAIFRFVSQAFLDGTEEVRERGLEEHLAQVRDDPDADAGGQPRAEVLHPPQLRRQGQAPVQHPRHHHRQPPRRRPRQRAAVRGHHHHQPLRRPRGHEALRVTRMKSGTVSSSSCQLAAAPSGCVVFIENKRPWPMGSISVQCTKFDKYRVQQLPRYRTIKHSI